MLADILPAGYEVGVLNGRVRPGDTVAVGLAAILTARLYSPSTAIAIDPATSRPVHHAPVPPGRVPQPLRRFAGAADAGALNVVLTRS